MNAFQWGSNISIASFPPGTVCLEQLSFSLLSPMANTNCKPYTLLISVLAFTYNDDFMFICITKLIFPSCQSFSRSRISIKKSLVEEAGPLFPFQLNVQLWFHSSHPLTAVFQSFTSTTADLAEYFSSRSPALRSLSDHSIASSVDFWTDNVLPLDFKSVHAGIRYVSITSGVECSVHLAVTCITFVFLFTLEYL